MMMIVIMIRKRLFGNVMPIIMPVVGKEEERI